jgi:UDP-2,3-diacylglucosamine pyrophosphatase LpxH
MENFTKRTPEVVVISDLHLGTYGSRAKELLNYLKTIQPKTLILNGDIIDIWQFNKRYFPKSHMKVIKYITSLLSEGTKVYYIPGNHDEMLRKFKGFQMGGFEIANKVMLNLDGKKAWVFHGDVFDVTMKHSIWLAKLGGKGYDLLIVLNTLVNWVSVKLGRGRLSFSKRIKDNVKSAIKFINNFESTVTQIAMEKSYDYVICGHIHQPAIKSYQNEQEQSVLYLNSGDWVENLTALEYTEGKWSLYSYANDPLAKSLEKEDDNESQELKQADKNSKMIFADLLEEFQMSNFKAN